MRCLHYFVGDSLGNERKRSSVFWTTLRFWQFFMWRRCKTWRVVVDPNWSSDSHSYCRHCCRHLYWKDQVMSNGHDDLCQLARGFEIQNPISTGPSIGVRSVALLNNEHEKIQLNKNEIHGRNCCKPYVEEQSWLVLLPHTCIHSSDHCRERELLNCPTFLQLVSVKTVRLSGLIKQYLLEWHTAWIGWLSFLCSNWRKGLCLLGLKGM